MIIIKDVPEIPIIGRTPTTDQKLFQDSAKGIQKSSMTLSIQVRKG